jgi:hypothetical protein
MVSIKSKRIGKTCDSCGKPFKGKPYPMVDEQHQTIRGLVQCEKCYSQELLGEDFKRIGTQRSPFGIGS